MWLRDDHDHHHHGHHGGHEHGADDHAGHDHAHDKAHDHAHPHDHAHDHHASHRDNNLRAAYVHVLADAATSVLAIGGLLLARTFGWLWIDPAVGLVGSCVIASWAYGLMRDSGAVLLDAVPNAKIGNTIRH
eukprot:gene42238-57182_t